MNEHYFQPDLLHLFIQPEKYWKPMWYMVAMEAPSEPPLPVFIPFHLKPGLAHVTCFVWWNINKYDAGGGLISTRSSGGSCQHHVGRCGLIRLRKETPGGGGSVIPAISAEPLTQFTLQLNVVARGSLGETSIVKPQYCETWKIVVKPGSSTFSSGKGHIVNISAFWGGSCNLCHRVSALPS